MTLYYDKKKNGHLLYIGLRGDRDSLKQYHEFIIQPDHPGYGQSKETGDTVILPNMNDLVEVQTHET